MKKLFLLLTPFLFFSCEQEDSFEMHENQNNEEIALSQDENTVTNADLDNVAKHFSSSKSRAENYSISSLRDENGNPCIYVLNFDRGGWALVSATKKYQPILAYNSEGYFDPDGEMPGGLKIWKENTAATISEIDNVLTPDTIAKYKNEWSAISPLSGPLRVDPYTDNPVFSGDFTQQDYNRLRSIMTDSITKWQAKGYRVETFENLRYGELVPGDYGTQGYTINDLIVMCEGLTHIYYMENFKFISCAVYRDEYVYETTGPTIKSKWGQTYPFNSSCPIINFENCYAGCGPVAVGQLMRHFQHPAKYDWSNMPLEYTAMWGIGVIPDFLYEIGQEMGTEYGTTDGSSTKLNDEISFFGKDYTFSDSKEINNDNLSKFIDGRLAFISAAWNRDKLEHVWLTGGRSSHQRHTRNDIYTFTLPNEMQVCGNMEQEVWYPKSEVYYMNWGYAGKYDGYYASSGWTFPGESSSGKPKAARVLYNFTPKK